MIRDRDFKPFQNLMDQLCAALRGWREAGDALVNAYWDALKDITLSEIEGNVKRIIATASKETPFPKPRDLRHRPPNIEAHDGKHDAALRLNESAWRELRGRDPVTFQIEVGMACAAREMAQLDAADPGHDEWQREYQRWASIRYAPRAVQEATVAKYLGRT